jgi:DNA-binding NarL/FixJ family response regulator
MRIQRTDRGVIHAIVLDSQPLWQRTLASMLARKGVRVAAVCSCASELAESVAYRPHLVVGDPETVAGFSARLQELRRMQPTLTAIVVSSVDDADSRRELMDAGAVEFIQKHCELEVIEAALGAAVDAHLGCGSQLTDRELQILELVAEGRTNRDVAALLWLSDQTVKFHLANVYRKLGVGGRREAVSLAQREGLLRTDLDRSSGEGGNEELVSAALA